MGFLFSGGGGAGARGGGTNPSWFGGPQAQPKPMPMPRPPMGMPAGPQPGPGTIAAGGGQPSVAVSDGAQPMLKPGLVGGAGGLDPAMLEEYRRRLAGLGQPGPGGSVGDVLRRLPPRAGADQAQGRIEKGAWNDPNMMRGRGGMGGPMGGGFRPPMMPQVRPMPTPGVGTAPATKMPPNYSMFGQPTGFAAPRRSVKSALGR